MINKELQYWLEFFDAEIRYSSKDGKHILSLHSHDGSIKITQEGHEFSLALKQAQSTYMSLIDEAHLKDWKGCQTGKETSKDSEVEAFGCGWTDMGGT